MKGDFHIKYRNDSVFTDVCRKYLVLRICVSYSDDRALVWGNKVEHPEKKIQHAWNSNLKNAIQYICYDLDFTIIERDAKGKIKNEKYAPFKPIFDGMLCSQTHFAFMFMLIDGTTPQPSIRESRNGMLTRWHSG